ncbi:MAG TPA: ribosome maturation factor RimM [Dissulfurispiraceae bacterium]|nr:ribosome maturation factor RimM [Dissulfurispiraceae bacterium]
MDDDAFITIGRIAREWGIRGEVLVMPLTFDPSRFGSLQEVFIGRDEGLQGRGPAEPDSMKILSARTHGTSVRLLFEGCETPEQARSFRSARIMIRRSESPPLPEGIYYHYQIIGLTVYTVEDLYLGTVTAIAETGSNDVYVVTGGGEEILLPAIKEVIRSIDLEEGRMVVALPAGDEV